MNSSLPPWKILVVDDADDVLLVTRLSLKGFQFEGRGLELLEASSATEAQEILSTQEDVAVAILDVVMETEHAGLDLVRWIRQERQNSLIRLLVRTGEAGLYPAASVIAEYQINDYWEKGELTAGRLQTALTTSLRSYEAMLSMHRRTHQLRYWADRFPDLLGLRDWNSLVHLVLLRLRELFPETELSAFLCRNDGHRWPLLAGMGRYPASGAPDVLRFLDEAKASILLDAWNRKTLAESPLAQALYFEVSSGNGHLFFLELPAQWQDYERNVTRLVLQNFRAALENRALINDLERHQNEQAAQLLLQESVTHDLHHRFQASLQVVLSFIEIESREHTGLSGRSPLMGAQRRLNVLAVLHCLLHNQNRLSGLNLQMLLQTIVEPERQEYWGVPVEVSMDQAVSLALAVVEMIDLVQSPRYRFEGTGLVQVVLADQPRRLSVGRKGATLAIPEPVPIEWQLLSTLGSQLGGSVSVDNGFLRLRF